MENDRLLCSGPSSDCQSTNGDMKGQNNLARGSAESAPPCTMEPKNLIERVPQQSSTALSSAGSPTLYEEELWKLCETQLGKPTESLTQQENDASLIAALLHACRREPRCSADTHTPLGHRAGTATHCKTGSANEKGSLAGTPLVKEPKELVQQGTPAESPSYLTSFRTRRTRSPAERAAEKEMRKQKGRLHTCDECGKTFNFKSVLLKHQKIHSTERTFKCEDCGAAFKQLPVLYKHRKTHGAVKPFICEQCNKSFHFRKDLQKHELTHVQEKPFECRDCGKTFAVEKRLEAHQKAQHDRVPDLEPPLFRCETCGQVFNDDGSLKAHEQIHSGKSFNCNHCSKVFGCDKLLTIHLKQHAAETKRSAPWKELFSCTQCKRTFQWESSLLIHQCSARAEKPFKCTICGLSFKYTSHLQAHWQIHTGDKCYSCEECGKGFTRRVSLHRHEVKHTGHKPYKCSLCGSGFCRKDLLLKHLKIHTTTRAKGLKQETSSTTSEESDRLQSMLLGCKSRSGCDNPLNCTICMTGKTVFSCTECKRNFQWESSLLLHQCSARPERPFKCVTCGMTFNSKSSLHDHGQGHSLDNLYSCEECGKGFTRRRSLHMHEMSHTGQKPYKCSHCGRTFSRKYIMEKHQKKHTVSESVDLKEQEISGLAKGSSEEHVQKESTHRNSNKPFKCTVCLLGFSHEIKRLVHERVHTDKEDYSCIECQKLFKDKRALRIHLQSHTGETTCPECGKTFSDGLYLTKHMRIHTGEMPYKCTDCGKAFKWKSVFEDHKRGHTGEKPYQCDQCDKSFSTRSAHVVHRTTHAVKAFQCAECEKCFHHKSELQRHQVLHTGEKPYQCGLCDKRFSWVTSLYLHRKTHIAVKPFQCTTCEKAFTHRAELTKHQVTHSGEKHFSCAECGKSFWFKKSLLCHKKTHSGEVQCAFPDCGKVVRHSLALKHHQKVHRQIGVLKYEGKLAGHGKAPFSCPQCGKRFAQKKSLSAHQRIHSGVRRSSLQTCVVSKYGCKNVNQEIPSQPVGVSSAGRPFWCVDCKLSFIDPDQFSEHHKVWHTRKRPRACVHCGETFCKKFDYEKHWKIHTTDMPAVVIAPSVVINRVTLPSTSAVSAAKKLIAVAKRTARKSSLVIKPTAGKLPADSATAQSAMAKCANCGENFQAAANLLEHLNTCTAYADPQPENSSLPSSECGLVHEADSSEERIFWCADCAVGFKYEAMFNRHRNTWHTPCHMRGRMPNMTSDLEKHQRTNNANKFSDAPHAAIMPTPPISASLKLFVTQSKVAMCAVSTAADEASANRFFEDLHKPTTSPETTPVVEDIADTIVVEGKAEVTERAITPPSATGTCLPLQNVL